MAGAPVTPMTSVDRPTTAATTDRDSAAVAADLSLPAGLRRQLGAFRRSLWTIKTIEAVCTAICGVLLAWLVLFIVDRCIETPPGVRSILFAVAAASVAVIPLACHRWIWRYRGLDQLARLIAGRFPSLGDQLLGIVEIVSSQGQTRGERGRSRALCAAAIRQVAEVAERHDLMAAVPGPRHRAWTIAAVALIAVGIAAALAVPAAASNGWMRLLAPWAAVERFTFARVSPLPEPLVVPHGEPVEVDVKLEPGTRWRPATAAARMGRRPLPQVARDGDRYRLALPPLAAPDTLALAVGDARQRVPVAPTHRPEVTEITAHVLYPDYLGRPEPLRKDVRGGTLAVVKGSTVTVSARVNRDLAAAEVDGAKVDPEGGLIAAPPVVVDGPSDRVFTWRDTLGLAAAAPLRVGVAAREDEPPTISVDGLAGRGVLLETETLRFEFAARDDFGVREVGLEWAAAGSGTGSPQGPPAGASGDRDGAARSGDGSAGEAMLAAGGPLEEAIDAVGTFSPRTLGIRPQIVEVRLYVEDYLPGRGRITSAPAVFVVMTPADHALWVNEQIARWRQQTAEVRDRELELLARNEELGRLPTEALESPEGRGALREQAAAEAHNGRRLARLAESGGALVRQAARNPEFDAATLEELAQHVQDLGAMAAARMPDIGSLLRQAADASETPDRTRAPAAAGEPSGGEPPPIAGRDRSAGGSASSRQGDQGQPPVPQVVDGERSNSRQNRPAKASEDGDESGGGGGAGRLGLPTTTVDGGGGAARPGPPRPPRELLDDAIDKQRRLVEDFAKIAGQLGDVMARLEGSTFVKRLKSASRSQMAVGEEMAAVAGQTFGNPTAGADDVAVARRLAAASRGNEELERKLSAIMDDMDAYGERRPLPALKSVLEEMRQLDVLGGIRQLTADLDDEAGLSIAQAEFWSDTLDRWADELVPPPSPGGDGGGGGEAAESLPPEVVLEAMKILEAETNLREETRVAEQIRKGVDAAAHESRAARLATDQQSLAGRVADLVATLGDAGIGPIQFEAELERLKRELMPGRSRPPRYAREIALFRQVQGVMADARGILAEPDTGRRAIAAETEAIELLLQAQFGGDSGGGGGGGNSPGGGGFGDTRMAALARLGEGVNRKARLESPEESQAIGTGGLVLPEEFRDGLDAYFNAFERGRREVRP